MSHILLVEPAYPIPAKSRNHKDFLPIGLLKIATLLRTSGADVRLARGQPKLNREGPLADFEPDEVWVSSLFTYWASYVRDAVQHYRRAYPGARLRVGGIYASLLPASQVMQYTGCDEVHQGTITEAEDMKPAYDLVEDVNCRPLDYQILHTSRGCPRRCRFCGTWIVEPEFTAIHTISDKIFLKKLVFYDNNLLMNPYIEGILDELRSLRAAGRVTWCESQSGFDGRVLVKKPYLARSIRSAGFRYPRIAWDGEYKQRPYFERQLELLVESGFRPRDISVFMLYNWELPFGEMEQKRVQCWKWGVQIADCRYRPLTTLRDAYVPYRLDQGPEDYYIHTDCGWSDSLVKQFRRNVRDQNICVRHGFEFYSHAMETKALGSHIRDAIALTSSVDDRMGIIRASGADCWRPASTRYPAQVLDIKMPSSSRLDDPGDVLLTPDSD